ncbi:MAG: hypothetical protein U5K28_08540 [Halobacteriales archaeon]|nr:hypothetical protein [Halobacteriales archaeon]
MTELAAGDTLRSSSVPLIAVFTYYFIKTIQPKYADVRSSVGKVNSRLENNLGGIQVIKTSNTGDVRVRPRRRRITGLLRCELGRHQHANQVLPRTSDARGRRLRAHLLHRRAYGARRRRLSFTSELQPGEFVTFILLSQRFIWPMAQFGQIINMYQRATRLLDARIFGLMDEPST